MFNTAQELIFDRYKHPRHTGVLEHPTHTAAGANPVCGDEVTLQVAVTEAGVISHIHHQSRACAICTAAADLLAEHLTGQPVAYVTSLPSTEVVEWLGIPLSPLRLKCALLPLETLKQAVGE